jgi:hypothetical protein
MLRWQLLTAPKADVLERIGKVISLRMTPQQRCALPHITADNGTLCYWITNTYALLQMLATRVHFPEARVGAPSPIDRHGSVKLSVKSGQIHAGFA